MSTVNPNENDPGVEDLDAEELRAELSARGLSTDGSVTVLAARLICNMRGLRPTDAIEGTGARDGRDPGDRGQLLPPRSEIARADSPAESAPRAAPRRTSSALRELHEHSPAHPRRSSGFIPHESTRNSASTSAAYNIMRKWNLHFAGATGEDSETFLLRIEEGRELIHVSDDDILRCLPFFLSGFALHWFRGKRDRIASWSTFKTAWRRRFGDPNYQFALREEILSRTQGEHEPVVNFFTCMSALFDRLSPPWLEEEKVSYAYRNLHPRLQVLIHCDDADDLEMLETLAINAEQRYSVSQRYRAPPTPDKSLIPDLAYRPPSDSRKTQKSRTGGALAALNIHGAKPNVPGTQSNGKTSKGKPSESKSSST